MARHWARTNLAELAALVHYAGLTPTEAINTLNKALLTALNTTEVKARLQVLGLEATPSSPKQMADYAAKERAKWGPIIKASGIKAD